MVIERFADPIVSLPPDVFRKREPVHLRSAIAGKIGPPVTIRQQQGLEPAASAVTVRSGTLRITNLHVDSEFVVVAEVDDVVAAATGASGTS